MRTAVSGKAGLGDSAFGQLPVRSGTPNVEPGRNIGTRGLREQRLKMSCVLISVSCVATALLGTPVLAVEGGSGFYLLGSRTTMGGFVPSPGTYFTATTYAFVGHSNLEFATGGVTLSGEIGARSVMLLPTALHIFQEPVLGGSFGVVVIVPIGWKGVSADFKLTGPAGGWLRASPSTARTRLPTTRPATSSISSLPG